MAAATGLLLTFVFGFLSFLPGVDPEVGGFLQLGLFVGGLIMIGGVIGYVVLSRRAGEDSKFERHLEQRQAAFASMMVGLAAVIVGFLWYLVQMLGDNGAIGGESPLAAGEQFASIDTPGIIAFLGFGTVYIVVATFFAIRAERSAIRLAKDQTGVKP